MQGKDKSLSKFLSLVLRHKPDAIGLRLDINGWALVDELLMQANLHQVPLSFDSLCRIVAANDKKRFEFSEDGQRIRARQGHSIEVDLQLKETVPPNQLFHGTATKNIAAIKVQGIIKGKRHHVHLSADMQVAKSVGARYGQPFVVGVNARDMHAKGIKFFLTVNGVWLTDHVPPYYLNFDLPH